MGIFGGNPVSKPTEPKPMASGHESSPIREPISEQRWNRHMENRLSHVPYRDRALIHEAARGYFENGVGGHSSLWETHEMTSREADDFLTHLDQKHGELGISKYSVDQTREALLKEEENS